jgi:hypothetical protein
MAPNANMAILFLASYSISSSTFSSSASKHFRHFRKITPSSKI